MAETAEKQEIQTIDQTQELANVQDMGSAMLSMFERVLLDPNVPVERVEKMMEMQERWEDRQAEKAFSEALAAAKADMPQVIKNQHNQQTRSNYADLEALDKAISPVVSKHGFSLSFSPAKSELPDHYGISCEIRHKAGHKETHHADIPVDGTGMKGNANKTATHAFGSTMSYGRRYLKMMIFDIATGDDDGNAAGNGETIDADQMQRIMDLIEETGTDIAQFCKYLKVDAIKHLPVAKLDGAIAALENKKGQADG